jgi:hypothetical protein
VSAVHTPCAQTVLGWVALVLAGQPELSVQATQLLSVAAEMHHQSEAGHCTSFLVHQNAEAQVRNTWQRQQRASYEVEASGGEP